MQTPLDPQAWLAQSHSHGVNLALKELMYYKAKAQLLELAPKVKIKNTLTGQYLAPHKGRGMEFAEVRHYQQGDDIRSIDWRVTARTGETHIICVIATSKPLTQLTSKPLTTLAIT